MTLFTITLVVGFFIFWLLGFFSKRDDPFAPSSPSSDVDLTEPLEDADGDFDLNSIEPFIRNLNSILGSHFTSAKADILLSKTQSLAVDSQFDLTYHIFSQDEPKQIMLRIFRDDIESFSVYFRCHRKLAAKLQSYMDSFH